MAFWWWILLSFPGFVGSPSLAEVGQVQARPQYRFFAAYSSSLGSLVGSQVSWVQPARGLGLSLSLVRTEQATYGGLDLTLQRSFLGGTWGLRIHYLRPLGLGSSGPSGFHRLLQGP